MIPSTQAGGEGKEFNGRPLAVLILSKGDDGGLQPNVLHGGATELVRLLLEPEHHLSATVIKHDIV